MQQWFSLPLRWDALGDSCGVQGGPNDCVFNGMHIYSYDYCKQHQHAQFQCPCLSKVRFPLNAKQTCWKSCDNIFLGYLRHSFYSCFVLVGVVCCTCLKPEWALGSDLRQREAWRGRSLLMTPALWEHFKNRLQLLAKQAASSHLFFNLVTLCLD